jgi:L-threonylcarbamoyladenylate synthase
MPSRGSGTHPGQRSGLRAERFSHSLSAVMHGQGRTHILPTHTPALFEEAVRQAVDLLRRGEVVALPTETVYGLAANALNPDAVARIYEVKGRPAHNPIICHVAGHALARRCVADWPELAEGLARAFWPGPLTLVLPRADIIPEIVTAGGHTVGIRWPSHPLMQAVIGACDFPLAAPSANLSNRLSPTNAAHVHRQLGNRIRLIVDGGQSQVGIESTVVDVSVFPPRLLRPGMIRGETLVAVTRELEGDVSSGILRSPGLLKRHYSPRARLTVLRWRDDADLRAQVRTLNRLVAKTCVVAHTQLPGAAGFLRVAVVPHDPEAYARALYGELHHCDELGAECIIVEALPDTAEWSAIADRLARAAA